MNLPRGSIATDCGSLPVLKGPLMRKFRTSARLDSVADQLVRREVGDIDKAVGGVGDQCAGLDAGLVRASVGRGQRAAGADGEAEDPAGVCRCWSIVPPGL